MNLPIMQWKFSIPLLMILPIGLCAYSADSNPLTATPSMTEEDRVTTNAINRYHSLKGEDQAMIENDRSMMKQGYDPNEQLGGFPKDNPNNSFKDQEQQVRGNA